jgi:hypothetical protein
MGQGKVPPEVSILFLIAIYEFIIGVSKQSFLDKYSAMMKLMVAPFVTIFLALILLIFTFMSIRVAGFFSVFYLYNQSYFAMFIYSQGGMRSAYNAMNQLFLNSIKLGSRSCPPNPTWFEKIIMVILEACYNHMMLILFIIVLFYGFLTYLTKMRSQSSKIIFASINSGVIFMILIYIIQSMRAYFKDKIAKTDFDDLGKPTNI